MTDRELLQQAFKYLKVFSRWLGGHRTEKMDSLMLSIEVALGQSESLNDNNIFESLNDNHILKHRHSEFIQAFADGEQIQALRWTKATDFYWETITNPDWNLDNQYRIKPQKVDKAVENMMSDFVKLEQRVKSLEANVPSWGAGNYDQR